MISFFISAVKIIFLLGFLILIHEGGHFIVAKLCNIKVNEFAIGFGPTIWKKQGKETKYALRLIPLGGFVSMEGEEERKDTERSFSNASIPKRIAVVIAGATVNIVFGLIAYFTLTAITGNFASNVINTTEGESAIAVLQSGDEILKLNDKKIRTKTDIDNFMKKSNGEEITVLIKRNDNVEEVKLKPLEISTKVTGINLAANNTGKEATKIVAIDKGSSAEEKGLEVNDIIKKVNGEDVVGNQERIVEIIKESDSVEFLIERDSEEIVIELLPKLVPQYFLGITLKQAEKSFLNNIYYGFFETGEFLFSIFDSLKMLVQGEVGVDQMVGPVGISNIVSKTEGFKEYIYMIALVSLSLGITNLLPIPALDGGKLLLLIIEAIRRKPLKEELEVGIQFLGFALLITFSIFITYKDITSIF